MSHLGFIRGFSYSKTDFICTLFRWIMHGYPVATLQHGISGYEFRWKHWPGKEEATRCDFVVVVLITNSPVPGRIS